MLFGIFKVNSKRFPAHKFVLQCRLGFDKYAALVKATKRNESNEEDEHVTVLNLNDGNQINQEGELEKWLLRIYTGFPQFVRNLIGYDHSENSQDDTAAAAVAECNNDADKKEDNIPEFDNADMELAEKMHSLSKLDIADPSDDYFEHPELEPLNEKYKDDGDSDGQGKASKLSGTKRVGTREVKSAYAIYNERAKDGLIASKKRLLY